MLSYKITTNATVQEASDILPNWQNKIKYKYYSKLFWEYCSTKTLPGCQRMYLLYKANADLAQMQYTWPGINIILRKQIIQISTFNVAVHN